MTKRLKIRFEGTTPGLPDGRLSLDAFREPLNLLLSAFRGVASQLESAALDEDSGPATGRFAKAARQLDLQIQVVRENSTSVEIVPATLADQLPLLPESLLDRTINEMLDNIEAESQGQLRNARVRKFLSALPGGIVRQDWSIWANGVKERTVTVGEIHLSEDGASFGYGMTTLSAAVAGVDFLPQPRVRLRVEGRTWTLDADADLVQAAVGCRSGEVTAKVVTVADQPKRLLWMRSAHAAVSVPDRNELANGIADEWSETLRILAT